MHVHLLGITCPISPAVLWQKEDKHKLSHLDNSLKAGEAAVSNTRNYDLG